MTQEINKPTVWILDDQWRSALTKLSWFFNFTEASFPATNTPDALKELDRSLCCRGWRLKSLGPDALKTETLRNGIVLIDVNWSAAPTSLPGIEGLSPAEKECFGITLTEEILAQREPNDNLDLILFSNSKGPRLSDYYVGLVRRGIERICPVVILDEAEDGPLIRKYGWEACTRVTQQLLQQIPASIRKDISDGSARGLHNSDFVQHDDFTAGKGDLRVEGICLEDLSVPFFNQVEAAEAKETSDQDAREAGRAPLKTWQTLLQGDSIAFELPEDIKNLTTAMLRALLRYKKVDHLDGFLHFESIRSSRYYSPAEKLKKTLQESKTSPENAVLYESFGRIVSVAIGSQIRKLADGEALEDLTTAFQNLPHILHDRTVFDVEGNTHTPTGKLSIFSTGTNAFRIKIADDVIWDNALIQAAACLDNFLTDEQASPELLFDILKTDPGNLNTCLEIARRRETLIQIATQEDPRWASVIESAQEQAFLLKRASDKLEAYSEYVQSIIGELPAAAERAFYKELTGSNPRMRQWDDWRETLESLLGSFAMPETLGQRLIKILETTDTPKGEAELEKVLSPYFPRIRAYTNKALLKSLERNGTLNSENSNLIARAFAKLFSKSNPEASRRAWISIAIEGLGSIQQELSSISDRSLEQKLVQSLSRTLIEKIKGLEGYHALAGDSELKEES